MKKNLSKVLVAALVIPTFFGAANLVNADGETVNSSTVEHAEALTAQDEYDKAYENAYGDKKEETPKENSSTKEHEDSLKAQDEYNKAYEDYYKDKKEEKPADKKEDKKTIPATTIEDIAKPIEKEAKEEAENNEVGFKTKAAAENAAKEALKNDSINKNFSVSENNGKFFYVLTAAEDLSGVKAPEEEKTPEKPFAKLDEKANEKSFDFDKGFKTKDEAIKQAETLVKNSKINKGYNISMGADGRYYIQLTPEETKTEGVERKPIEDKKDGKLAKVKDNTVSKEGKGSSVTPDKAGSNVQTGVAGLTGVVATLAAATTAFFKSKRK